MNKNASEFINTKMFSKNGEVLIKLSRYLFTLKEGERLLTMSELAKIFNAGVGTVLSALQNLQEINAVSIESRGHKGTYVTNLNRNILWRTAMHENIKGIMPLLYSKRLLGLGTGLYTAFEKSDIPLNMSYMRGGFSRIQQLNEEKVDFVICSLLTAQNAAQENKNLQIMINFGAQSHFSNICLLFRKNIDKLQETALKVGIDNTSYDHKEISRLAFQGKNVEHVPLSYNDIFTNLNNGIVDCVMTTYDVAESKINDYDVKFFKDDDANSDMFKEIISKLETAALLVRKDNDIKNQIIKDLIDLNSVKEIQQNVLNDIMIPRY